MIVAGGSGSRMGGGIPKQFQNLCGRPVLWWSMKAFHEEDPHTSLIVVLPENFISLWQDFFSTLPEEDRFAHSVTAGGSTRTESVKNGLSLIPEDAGSLIAVHDGARPLVTPALIRRGWEAAQEKGCAIPTVAVTDSLRKLTPEGSEAIDRSEYMAVQTPQVFQHDILKQAYKDTKQGLFTDDASVVEKAGHKISLYPGEASNMKLTNPKDLEIAEVILKQG